MKCMVKKSLSTVSDLLKDSLVEPINSGLDMTELKGGKIK